MFFSRENKPNKEVTNHDYDYLFKIVMLGDAEVGKSALQDRFVDLPFSESHNKTVGNNFKTKIIDENGKKIKVELWDSLAEQKVDRVSSSEHLAGAHAFIVMYDVTNQASFNNAKARIEELKKFKDSICILVGNKCDLVSKKIMDYADVLAYAAQKDLNFIECSAKTGANVTKLFSAAALMFTQRLNEKKVDDEKAKNAPTSKKSTCTIM